MTKFYTHNEPFELECGYVLPEAIHLLSLLKDTDFLLPISEGDVMTDQALDWWLKNNPAKAKRAS